MIALARGDFSAQEIKNALHGRSGSRTVKFRCDVLRNGATPGTVRMIDGSVALNRFSTIQRTARFTLAEEIDWLSDELRPVMLLKMNDAGKESISRIMPCAVFDALCLTAAEFDALNITGADLDNGYVTVAGRVEQWVEYPLGVFIPSTPRRNTIDGVTSWEVEAYDRTVILKEDSITEALYFEAGDNYLDAVQSVLISAGISNIIIDDYTDLVLPNSRVFDIGTSKLSISNTLLSEAGYNPVSFSAQGEALLIKYVDLSARSVDYIYAANDLSVIDRDTSIELDAYGVPNIFIAVCSNPELKEDYVATWINDSPVSRLSTVSRGRNITSEIYQPDSIASQEALDSYIAHIGWEATLRGYETLEFSTALMPIHGSGDILSISHSDVTGIFVESSWEMPLKAGERMTHSARRLIGL